MLISAVIPTVGSAVDHYMTRPATLEFKTMTLLHFVQHYTLPKQVGVQLLHCSKSVVVIIRPYILPDPEGPKYEEYCLQKLMLYRPFCQQQTIIAGFDTYAEAYTDFLQSGNVPPSLLDDIHRLEQQTPQVDEEDDIDELHTHSSPRTSEEWMLLCQLNSQLQHDTVSIEDFDWTNSAQNYANLKGSLPHSSQYTEKAPCNAHSLLLLIHTSFKANNYKPIPLYVNTMSLVNHNLLR